MMRRYAIGTMTAAILFAMGTTAWAQGPGDGVMQQARKATRDRVKTYLIFSSLSVGWSPALAGPRSPATYHRVKQPSRRPKPPFFLDRTGL